MNIMGIDLALRNTACVVLDENYNSIDFCILTSDKKLYDDERLLVYNADRLSEFRQRSDTNAIFIEGLSLSSASLAKDIIAGNFWYIRTLFHLDKDIVCNVVAPASWRARVFTVDQKAEIKEFRKNNGGKYTTILKEIALRHVPEDLLEIYKKYLTDSKLSGKFIYDLSDAFCIAKYGIMVNYDTK
jgi:hypothetical protein